MILVKKGGAFMATVSYGLKITSAYHIFDETIKIYRKAVEYITDITLLRFDELTHMKDIRNSRHSVNIWKV